MITANHINQSIEKAISGQSNLGESELKVRGFSPPTVRKLFNNLCNLDNCIYLEVGLFCGGTFVSSFNKNCTSIGIENHSQDFSEGFELVKKELKENVDAHSDKAKEVYVHYVDCFNMDLSLLPNGIDIFFFDGTHTFESQAKALPYFFDKMADTFIFIVDDYGWKDVKEGTEKGLNDLADKMEVEYCHILRGERLNDDPIFHNGVAIFLIKKK